MAEVVEALDLGLAGTVEMYSATTHFAADGGISVIALHIRTIPSSDRCQNMMSLPQPTFAPEEDV